MSIAYVPAGGPLSRVSGSSSPAMASNSEPAETTNACRPRPADNCCFLWTAAQGVQMLSTYALIYGLLCMVSLFSQPQAKDENYATILTYHQLMQSFGFAFGCRGIYGLLARDSLSLLVFTAYYPYSWIVSLIITIWRQPYLCAESLNPGFTDKECAALQTTNWIILGVMFLLFSYFTWICWSVYYKVNRYYGAGLNPLDDADGIGLVPYQPHQGFLADPGRNGGGGPYAINAQLADRLHPHQPQPAGQRLQEMGFTPFQGQGHQLD